MMTIAMIAIFAAGLGIGAAAVLFRELGNKNFEIEDLSQSNAKLIADNEKLKLAAAGSETCLAITLQELVKLESEKELQGA